MHLYIYGAGGTGREMVDIARRCQQQQARYQSVRFVDDVREERVHYDTAVCRFDEMLAVGEAFEVVIAQGEPAHRRALYDRLRAHDVALATLVDPTAMVSLSARLEPGCVLWPGVVVSSNTVLAANTMVQFNTVVGHDIRIGAHTVVSSSAVIGGNVDIGEGAFIGMGAAIKERLTVGAGSIIGMSSAVFRSIEDGMIAVGNPARVVQANTEQRVFKG